MEPLAERYTGPESVSVVIPTSRGGADLERCLVSLAAQRTKEIEVIVVDNASDDAELAALPARFPGLVLLRNASNLGFVGACNQGIEIANGEWILLLNDDTELQADALGALADALRRNGSWGACQAKLLLMEDPTRLDTAGSFLTNTGFLIHRGSLGPERDYTASDEIFAAKGAALLLRREALEQVGVFDSDFFAYFEETDLCWRLWLASCTSSAQRPAGCRQTSCSSIRSRTASAHCSRTSGSRGRRGSCPTTLRCALDSRAGMPCAASRGSAARSSAPWRGMSPIFPRRCGSVARFRESVEFLTGS